MGTPLDGGVGAAFALVARYGTIPGVERVRAHALLLPCHALGGWLHVLASRQVLVGPLRAVR